MSRVVILTGGGIKGAAAAGRYAAEHEITLLHLNLGPPAAHATVRAVQALSGALPSARAVVLDLPHVAQLARQHRLDAAARGTGREPPPEAGQVLLPESLHGLLPVILAIGVQVAEQTGAAVVASGLSRLCDAASLGLHVGSKGVNRLREFLHAFQVAVESAPSGGSKVRLETPLLDVTYAQMISLAQRFNVPLERTWTCDTAGAYPCKNCDGCRRRAAAFLEALQPDPLLAAALASAGPLRTHVR